MDFNQLVRVWVDTNVNTHFIVSLPRISPVAELRELIKVTHMHCYPDMGDVKIGKLAVGPKSFPICKFVFWDSIGIFTTILYSFLFLSLVG
jgi:hypothetical protein